MKFLQSHRLSICFAILPTLILSIALLTPTLSYADELNQEQRIETFLLDDLEIAVDAQLWLEGYSEETNLWRGATRMVQKVPLYDHDLNVVAIYATFDNDTFIILNNSRETPSPVGFGPGVHYLIDQLLTNKENPTIIFNSWFSAYDYNTDLEEHSLAKQYGLSYQTTYPDFEEPNEEMVKDLAYHVELAKTGVNDFATFSNDKSRESIDSEINHLDGINQATTGDFSNISPEHCNDDNATPVVLNRETSPELSSGGTSATCAQAQQYVSNGAVVAQTSNNKNYLAPRGIELRVHDQSKTISNITYLASAHHSSSSFYRHSRLT